MIGLFRGAIAATLLLQVAAADQPNILLILADDVGSEALECYGGQSYRTPELNRLAKAGLRFTHAYTMPVCHPTRTTLLSGQYPFRMGRPDWGTFPRSAESQTLAHVLKRAGYATAIAGKWQLTLLGEDPTHPHRLGFDEYCLFGWHEGGKYYQPHIRQNGQLRMDVRDRYGPDVFCEYLIDFISRHRDQPFFAFYSMGLCHAVTNDLDKPVPVGPNGRYQTFGEMVAAMDVRVGRLLDAVDDAGLAEKTVVFFFTDNGSPAKNIDGVEGDELVYRPVTSLRNGVEVPGGKGQLTDAGTRVPLMVRWPGKIAAGEVTDQLVDVSDFLPTLAEIAGGTLPENVTLDGRSFANLLVGKDGPARQWVYAEHKGAAFVKDRRWKLYDDGRLFDLASDPGEDRHQVRGKTSGQAQAARRKLQHAFSSLGMNRAK